MNEERRGVYPFCAAVRRRRSPGASPTRRRDRDRQPVLRPPRHLRELRFVGPHALLHLPVDPGGEGRSVPDHPDRRPQLRQPQGGDETPLVVVPREPASAIGAHPELDRDPSYKQAEAYWDDSEPGQALPFYQSALTLREKRAGGRRSGHAAGPAAGGSGFARDRELRAGDRVVRVGDAATGRGVRGAARADPRGDRGRDRCAVDGRRAALRGESAQRHRRGRRQQPGGAGPAVAPRPCCARACAAGRRRDHSVDRGVGCVGH